jgi:hypothetical protein
VVELLKSLPVQAKNIQESAVKFRDILDKVSGVLYKVPLLRITVRGMEKLADQVNTLADKIEPHEKKIAFVLSQLETIKHVFKKSSAFSKIAAEQLPTAEGVTALAVNCAVTFDCAFDTTIDAILEPFVDPLKKSRDIFFTPCSELFNPNKWKKLAEKFDLKMPETITNILGVLDNIAATIDTAAEWIKDAGGVILKNARREICCCEGAGSTLASLFEGFSNFLDLGFCIIDGASGNLIGSVFAGYVDRFEDLMKLVNKEVGAVNKVIKLLVKSIKPKFPNVSFDFPELSIPNPECSIEATIDFGSLNVELKTEISPLDKFDVKRIGGNVPVKSLLKDIEKTCARADQKLQDNTIGPLDCCDLVPSANQIVLHTRNLCTSGADPLKNDGQLDVPASGHVIEKIRDADSPCLGDNPRSLDLKGPLPEGLVIEMYSSSICKGPYSRIVLKKRFSSNRSFCVTNLRKSANYGRVTNDFVDFGQSNEKMFAYKVSNPKPDGVNTKQFKCCLPTEKSCPLDTCVPIGESCCNEGEKECGENSFHASGCAPKLESCCLTSSDLPVECEVDHSCVADLQQCPCPADELLTRCPDGSCPPSLNDCCPCKEGEACLELLEGLPDFGRRHCQPCPAGEEVDPSTGRACVPSCPIGYEYKPGAAVGDDPCQDIDECVVLGGLCGENKECTNIGGGYTCPCKAGYEGASCENIDECEAYFGPPLCRGNQKCTDTQGSYACDLDCKEGYLLCSNGNCFSSCCGDGTCQAEYGEDSDNCFQDCTVLPSCGDSICEAEFDENKFSCRQDCGEPCPDGTCDISFGETIETCRQDCFVGPIFCGDGFCDTFFDPPEDQINCRVDCYDTPIRCGDGLCDADLGEVDCRRDCGPAECGDGFCDDNLEENEDNCFDDCAPGAPNCPGGRDCGNGCFPLGACCPDEKECVSGSCRKDSCCPEDRYCFPPIYAPRPRGDPFIRTYFGVEIECQAQGEFIFAKSLQSSFELQVRFAAIPAAVSASVTTGFVLQDPGYPTIQLSVQGGSLSPSVHVNECPIHIFVDGVLLTGISGQELVDGFEIDNGRIQIELVSTTTVRVAYAEHMLELSVVVQNSRAFGCFFDGPRLLFPIFYHGGKDGYRFDETIYGVAGSPYGGNFFKRDGTPFFPESPFSPDLMYQYCTEQFCVETAASSLFTYEPGLSFDNFYNCSAPYVGVDLEEAPPEVVAVCGADIACLVDGIVASAVAGIEAATEAAQISVQTQVMDSEETVASLFRFSHGVIPAFKPTTVLVTIELTGAVENLEGFALYRVFVESFSQAPSTETSLLDVGSGIGEDDVADDSIFSGQVTLEPTFVGELFGFRGIPIIDGSEESESPLVQTSWSVVRAYATEQIPTPNGPVPTPGPTGTPGPTPGPAPGPTPSRSEGPTFSMHPSDAPTIGETTVPTGFLTSGPTSGPIAGPATAKPTAKPTTEPTTKPTAKPTAEPTATATTTPTTKPTAKPTATSTTKPTTKPTAKPI